MTKPGGLLMRNSQIVGVGLTLIAALSLPFATITNSQDDGSRQIVLEEFTKARPPATKAQTPGRRGPRTSMSARLPKGPRYIRKSTSVIASLKANSEVMQIGLTVWRLRPSS